MGKNIIILSVILFFVTVTSAIAQDHLPTITVYGSAEIEVVPDEMYWSIEILNRGSDIKTLSVAHQANLKGFLTQLTDRKVEDAQTSMMQISENWAHKNGQRVLDGYYASSMVSFKLTDFNLYESLWQDVAHTPGGNIQNISYGYSKQNEVKGQARIKALLAAKEKAMTMVKAINPDDSISHTPFSIEELSFSPIRQPNALMARTAFKSSESSPQAFSLGKIHIDSQVKVIFLLINHMR